MLKQLIGLRAYISAQDKKALHVLAAKAPKKKNERKSSAAEKQHESAHVSIERAT